MDQYSRLALYYEPHQLRAIQGATICVCGLGGVGGSCVEMIARMGVRRLILVDYDRVDLTNLNRQLISNYENVGELKTEVARRRIESFCSRCEIVTYPVMISEQMLDFLELVPDYVIDCIDMMDAKIALIKACQERNIPIISSMGMANRVDPSAIRIGKLHQTFNDPMAKSMRTRAKRAGLKPLEVVFSTEVPKKIVRPVSSVPFVVNTAGNFLASVVIHKISLRADENRSLLVISED